MGLEFEEQDQGLPPRTPVRQQRGLTGMLLKAGIVKSKQQANYIYIALIVVLGIVMYLAVTSL